MSISLKNNKKIQTLSLTFINASGGVFKKRNDICF